MKNDFTTKARKFTEEFRRKGVPDEQIRSFLSNKFREESTVEGRPDIKNVLGNIKSSFQERILPVAAKVTQVFGNRNPAIEIFSKGINTGTDFAVAKGTPVSLPPGNWQVIKSFSGAKEGARGANSGYGNSILAKNTDTGETIRFSHLSRVNVKPGQAVRGGMVVGLSGNTGNSTGPHLDVEYRDKSGKLADILRSRYGGFIS